MCIRKAAATMILKIREKHRIPLSVMDTIIVDVQSLLDVAMSDLSDQICNKLGYLRKLLGGLSPFLVSFLEFLMACTHSSSSSPIFEVTSTS